jgi:uracil-DNA glycosylase
MRPDAFVKCVDFPCQDTDPSSYCIPGIQVDPTAVKIMLISEAPPENLSDYYYSGADALFTRTTVLAFQDAGARVQSVADILSLGVYLTTAVKCGKTGYGIATDSIAHCSYLLEKEIGLFPNIMVFLLMGDVAIKSVNMIAKRNGEPRVIPAGPTYKIRGGRFEFRAAYALPSYVQAGPAFFVEKSKRRMIAEDIDKALRLISCS